MLAEDKGVAARRGLKEVLGKALVRRTGTTYEAGTPDEGSRSLKVRYLTGRRPRKCGGHKREGNIVLPGEISGHAPRSGRRQEAPVNGSRSQPRA